MAHVLRYTFLNACGICNCRFRKELFTTRDQLRRHLSQKANTSTRVNYQDHNHEQQQQLGTAAANGHHSNARSSLLKANKRHHQNSFSARMRPEAAADLRPHHQLLLDHTSPAAGSFRRQQLQLSRRSQLSNNSLGEKF